MADHRAVRGAGRGAGLPALAVVGGRPHPGARVVALVRFGVVLPAVALGITVVVASGSGEALGSEHVHPMIVDE